MIVRTRGSPVGAVVTYNYEYSQEIARPPLDLLANLRPVLLPLVRRLAHHTTPPSSSSDASDLLCEGLT
jgi:hypothetical protein